MKVTIKDYLTSVAQNFEELKQNSSAIENAASVVITALNNKNKIIFCGNGGSAADSQHLAAELMGRYKVDRSPLPAIAVTVDTSALTAIANDYGYDNVFSRQINGLGTQGDVLFALSTSGKSESILGAIKTAKNIGMKIISLTGSSINEMNDLSDVCINVPSKETNHIQEMHITIGHLICGLVEDELFEK